MSHIVESCPLTKLNGGLSRLHSADEDTVSWLTNYGSWHAYEKKITTSKIQTVQCWLSALCAVTDRGTTKPVCVLWLTGILRSLFVCCDWQGYYEACLCVLTDRGITKPVRCVLWWGDNLRGDLSSLAGQQRSSRAGRQGRRRQVSATVLHVVRWNVSELMATGWTLQTLRSRHSVM